MENAISKSPNLLRIVEVCRPKILQLNWPDQVQLELFEFESRIQIEGFTGIGRGSSFSSQDHALEVSFTEALERIVTFQNGFSTTNGIAGHQSIDMAADAAVRELIERHVFLLQFYGEGLRGAQINTEFAKSWTILSRMFDSFDVKNFYLASIVANGIDYYVVVNLCKVKNAWSDGYVLGLGCSTKIETAKKSAEIESLRYVYHLSKDSSFKSIDLNSFRFLPKPSFEDHGALALDRNYANSISEILDVKIFEPMKHSLVIDVEELSLPPNYNSIGLVFARAFSNEACELFTGIPKGSDLARLNQILKIHGLLAGPNIKLPHPMA